MYKLKSSAMRSMLSLALACNFFLMAEGFAQDDARLKAIQVEGEKLGRTADEVTPNVHLFTQYELEQLRNNSVFSTVGGVSNVVIEEDGTLPSVRGISSLVNTNGIIASSLLPRVPVLVDNVATPIAQSAGYLHNSSWDVGVVEVAKGPQPTSTGRNAFSGAIRIYTNDPVFTPEYAVRASGYDLRDEDNLSFMINQPFMDEQIAIRLVGDYRDGDTLVRIGDSLLTGSFDPNEKEYEEYRAKIRFAPKAIQALDLQISYALTETKDQYAPVVQPATCVPAIASPPTCALDPSFPPGTPNPIPITSNAADEFSLNHNFAFLSGYNVSERERYIAEGSYQFSNTYKLFVRASRMDNLIEFPDPGSPSLFRSVGELGFASEEDELEIYMQISNAGFVPKGVVGIIYNDAEEDVDNTQRQVPNLFALRSIGSARNLGIYGEVEMDAGSMFGMDGLTMIAGGRYEWDDRSKDLTGDGMSFDRESFSESIFLPKLGLRYNFDDDTEVGYTYSESYRPAGAELDIVSGFVAPLTGNEAISRFNKETIDNHEVYIKQSWLDSRLKLGANAFYYEYKDAQVGLVPSVFPGFELTGNIPKAEGVGVELSGDFAPGNGWTFNTNIGWLDTEITDAGGAVLNHGDDLPQAPKWSGSIGVDYEHASGWQAAMDMRHTGKMKTVLRTNPAFAPDIDLSSYTIYDLSFGYDFEGWNGGDLNLSAAVTNLFDKAYFNDIQSTSYIAGYPRTFRLGLTGRF